MEQNISALIVGGKTTDHQMSPPFAHYCQKVNYLKPINKKLVNSCYGMQMFVLNNDLLTLWVPLRHFVEVSVE